MFAKAILAAGFAILGMSASAQDAPRTILVLDGSGSMWGQIDGVAKITIAQDVVGSLLGTLPENQELGLTVYGHRRKGDCTDIETIVAPGSGTRDQIAGAVSGISPKGKTPMTAAITAAAEALRFTEEKATVILVSDGIETCEPDPCAAARALEQAGVDFTAHVIGFDVTEQEALRQMQCLAEETGGTFRTASNAAELSDALLVVAEPAPPPPPVMITLRATEGENGRQLAEDLVWTLTTPDGAVFENRIDDLIQIELVPGEYTADVLRPKDEESAAATFGVGEVSKVVTLVLPEFRPGATIDAPASAPAGSIIQVRWTGPNAKNDYIAISEIESAEGAWRQYTYTREGPLLELQLPAFEGQYELRYVLGDGRKLLASIPFEVTPVTATVAATDALVAGDDVTVEWTGPAYRNDYVAVTARDEDGWINYTYTREGSPLKLTMPPEGGDYDLVYTMGQDRRILARVPISVATIMATVDVPDGLVAGATVLVPWTGPDYRNDFIAVTQPGEDAWINYAYTRDGSPVKLQMPPEAGDYDIVYNMQQGRRVLVRVPVTVAAVGATLDLPQTLIAGDTVPVTWTGPDYRNDFIAVTERGEEAWINLTYTRDGSPLGLQMPADPGDYDVIYTLDQDRKVLARVPVTVVGLAVSVSAPASAAAGSDIVIEWAGPDYKNDFVAVVEAGADEGAWINYTYTRDGSPLRLTAPLDPGQYEIRYVIDQDRKTLAAAPIEITAVSASLTAPNTAEAGSSLIVEWDGPAYKNDYLSIGRVSDDPLTYETYNYTRDGTPLKLQVPSVPGEYEVRYILEGRGKRAIATVPLTVTAVDATIEIAETVEPGSNLVISWTGPDNPGDYIAISKSGDTGYETYVYTRDGSPIILKVPQAPGDYEVRYVLKEDNTVVTAAPLSVE